LAERATQPNLSEFLCLVELMSRRLLDLVALFAEPARLPSVAERWQRIDARKAAYQMPWSHAVLRALEIEAPYRKTEQLSWLSQRIGISVEGESLAVTTSQDVAPARDVKILWTRTALERLEQTQPGNFGYMLFAASRSDLRRLRGQLDDGRHDLRGVRLGRMAHSRRGLVDRKVRVQVEQGAASLAEQRRFLAPFFARYLKPARVGGS
jgi:hypothetical protein